MNESEKFWYSVICAFADGQQPVLEDANNILGETPAWVTKLTVELMAMIMPRVQLRIGQRATPERVGALVGAHMALCHEVGVRMGPNADDRDIYQQAMKLIEPAIKPFRPGEIAGEVPQLLASVRRQFDTVMPKILERPIDECSGFFAALGRGLRKPKSTLMPEIVDGKPKASPLQMRRIRTMTVYWVTLMNWQAIDRLTSSKEAYDFLCKLLPIESVGHDRERIRRMFSRLGKQFKAPGRPPEK